MNSCSPSKDISNAEEIDNNTNETGIKEVKLSKNQQKRLIREQKRNENKAEWRKLQKSKRKLKDNLKKKELLAQGIECPVKKRFKADPSKEKTGKVIIDLSFDGIMVNREVKSLFSQIMRCYSANRRSNSPFHIEVSSFSGEISQKFKLTYPEHDRWDISFNSQHFLNDASDKDNIVYLTPDSDTILDSIDQDCTYVIGGIVDKNRFKGKTLQTANDLHIKTARLPVPEFIDLKTSPVLTIYHVFEIMLKFKDCLDWKEALELFVPKRNLKNLSESSEDN